MSDSRTRELERLAKRGDPLAAAALERARERVAPLPEPLRWQTGLSMIASGLTNLVPGARHGIARLTTNEGEVALARTWCGRAVWVHRIRDHEEQPGAWSRGRPERDVPTCGACLNTRAWSAIARALRARKAAP